MTNSDTGSVDVDPSKYMTLGEVVEDLTGEKIVGIVDGFEPGPVTVTYSDKEAAFRNKADAGNGLEVGDDESTIFVASDDGDLSLGYGPHFDSTIVTNLKRKQLKAALSALREAGDKCYAAEFDVHFDHAGPIIFEGEVTVATTPMRYPWDFASHDRPKTGPCGPSIRGGSCE